MSITRDFKLSLVAGRSVPLVINANQYDDGEVWRFTLLDENGQKYSPSTGSIIGLKSDGHIITNAGTVTSTGLVLIAETEQMTASPGKNFYELLIDDDTHGTANFIVFVEPRPGAGGTPSDSDLAVFQEAIDAAATIGDVVDLVDDVDVLEARMDEFARLPDGSLSTAADAELVDIRVGADGTTYPTAGNAVRGQYSDLKNALDDGLYNQSTASYSIMRNPTETYPLGWRVGAVSKSTGGLNYNTTNYLLGLAGTTGFFEFPNEYTIQVPPPYTMDVFEYNGSFLNANYITHYDGVTSFSPKKGCVYRIQIGNFNGEASSYLTEAFLQSVIVTETINDPIFVDKLTYNAQTDLYDTQIEELQNTVSETATKYIGRFGNPIYKLPVTNTPESMAFLGNNTYLWCADDNKIATQNMRMVIYENGYNSAPTTKRITHTLGHMNTVDFKNGALIFGNGGSGNYNGGTAQSPNNGYIYIIEDFIEKFEEHLANGTTMTLSDAISIECNINTTEYANDSKFNVIFGETNINYDRDTRNNIIYLVTSTLGQNLYNTKVRRILLGLGTNQLENGTFISGKATNEFNGTYKILNTYLGESDGTDFSNDMTFVNGNIISNVGETNIRVQIFTLDDSNNRIVKSERNYARFNDDGSSVGTNQWTSGISFDDINNYVFIGFSSSGGIFIYNANSIGL